MTPSISTNPDINMFFMVKCLLFDHYKSIVKQSRHATPTKLIISATGAADG